MKILKNVTLFAMLFMSIVAVAQQDNIFLDRSFWKGNPDLKTVKQKIAEGNDAKVLNENAFDATIYALLEKADDDVVKFLLSLEGNPVDKKTHDSRIYLHWAAYAGQTEMVKYLLDNRSSVTELDSHGYTPLAFAANAGQKDKDLYEAFEKHGINLVNEKNESGANLLLLVAPSLSTEKELSFFTSKGFKLEGTDNNGNGIFNYASKKGNIDFLKLLIKKGVDYKSLNQEGGNAFLFATQGGRGYSNPLAVYEYLKSLGLKPNIVTKDGYTPLHRLAYNNTDPAIFEFFLTAGADVNQKDSEGNTPFLNAASRNELAMVHLLSKNLKDVNTANNDGQAALMLAVQHNSSEVVGFLLEKGSVVFAKDSKGNTMAYYLVASFDGRKPDEFDSKLKLLQEKGFKMNTTQAEGNTLFHLAAKDNNIELLKSLADFDIDTNAKNDEGLTVLHIAAMKAENDEMMKYLISKGADTKIKTDFEETVYDLASENELLKKQNTSLNFLK
ncbi:Ankyrin repeat [Gillisia sp. Hel1_33_143]|uniref:ankyrin repeat domain-containing protein n=1 Tax=Gillisia sp. Hel1_33_143 TaxID=1336796 RepID=UPI00087BB9F6|nr:ankyrin repeat domain-containing protein [Gillisia sp. Hel1_33_143]SDS00026.1 Ankyrin repeat [Gillisia sp. Hel1_33_143]